MTPELHDPEQLAFQQRFGRLGAAQGVLWLGGLMRLLVWRNHGWPLTFARLHEWDRELLMDLFWGRVNDHRVFWTLARQLRLTLEQVFLELADMHQRYGAISPDRYDVLAEMFEPEGRDRDVFTRLLVSRKRERRALLEQPHAHPLFYVAMAEATKRRDAFDRLIAGDRSRAKLDQLVRPVLLDHIGPVGWSLELIDPDTATLTLESPRETALFDLLCVLSNDLSIPMVGGGRVGPRRFAHLDLSSL